MEAFNFLKKWLNVSELCGNDKEEGDLEEKEHAEGYE